MANQIVIRKIKKILDEAQYDAERYLKRMRHLKANYGEAFPIVHGWFFSTNSKWTIVEPQIFKLYFELDYLDIETILSVSEKKILRILKPLGFQNVITRQFRNFSTIVKQNFKNWQRFSRFLETDGIFPTYEIFRGKNARLTFKNLVGIMANLGIGDNLVISDRYFLRVFNPKADYSVLRKYRTDPYSFKELLKQASLISEELERIYKLSVSPIVWSLSIWFSGSRTRMEDLEKLEMLIQI